MALDGTGGSHTNKPAQEKQITVYYKLPRAFLKLSAMHMNCRSLCLFLAFFSGLILLCRGLNKINPQDF